MRPSLRLPWSKCMHPILDVRRGFDAVLSVLRRKPASLSAYRKVDAGMVCYSSIMLVVFERTQLEPFAKGEKWSNIIPSICRGLRMRIFYSHLPAFGWRAVTNFRRTHAFLQTYRCDPMDVLISLTNKTEQKKKKRKEKKISQNIRKILIWISYKIHDIFLMKHTHFVLHWGRILHALL